MESGQRLGLGARSEAERPLEPIVMPFSTLLVRHLALSIGVENRRDLSNDMPVDYC
jgi:hypothetical protein